MKWIFVSLFFLFFFFTPSVSLVSAKSVSVIAISGQYIKRVNSVRAYFGNLKGVKTISYTLMYEGNGVGQGVMGTVSPGKKTAVSKDIYLGTCSARVCTPQRNIKNIQLEIVANYTTGKSTAKTIKIK